jgi:hypothetical protein
MYLCKTVTSPHKQENSTRNPYEEKKKRLDINTNYLIQIQNKFLNWYNAHNTKQFKPATF